MVTRKRKWLAVMPLALAIALLGGCSAASVASKSYAGYPKGSNLEETREGSAPIAIWIERGEVFSVTIFSPSSCVPIPVNLTASESNRVAVEMARPNKSACTADEKATTFEFALPDGADGSSPIRLTITGLGKDYTSTLD